MSPANVVPETHADQALWDQAVGDLPAGCRFRAIRWRDGSYQVQADLPHGWHRPHSRIDRTAVGTGPTLAAAITVFRAHLFQIRADLSMPGQALWRDPDLPRPR